MKYKVISEIPDHLQVQDEVTLKLWPEFMLHDPVSNSNWVTLFELFPEYQLSLQSEEGEIIGVANSLPFYWDKPFRELPEKGWDWVLKKGIADRLAKKSPNVLNGLQIAVNKPYRGKGVSTLILKEMKARAREKGFKYLTIPVRPSLKSSYPLIAIDNYISWQREDNLPFDPWLRVQVREGGEIIKPCHQAMYIPGTLAEWEEWTGMKFMESGQYIVPGALNPVVIKVEEDLGEYIEPNVWVIHKLD